MTLHHLSTHLNGVHLIHPQSPRLSSISPFSVSLPSIPHRTQFQSLVLCARRRRKKRAGHGRIARLMFKSLSLLSTNLQILPQPLDLVIADLGGGRGGGGGGSWRGWGRFDGWRRKPNRVPILILVCVMLWIYGYCKVSGKVIKSDEILKVLGACVLGISLVKELKREARSLVFVFLSLIASFVFGFKKESLVKLASQVRSCSSSVLLSKRRSRRRV
ncbi:hypothetical protein Bca4012_079121 [Brassica carinata]|uniref:Uncharacterized protein n=2 Tax=Brassica TaxID=3705 RepID=A0A0D3DCG2_BRAOL|nr:PREDICTED: uncharacterized protein LOC106305271 [Brassica oleracea var. oleracea]XP_013647291.1 uncharacterized protein BNAC07G28020D [Brassica napus]CAF2012534.1 unnamed protein product [Brassica napus]